MAEVSVRQFFGPNNRLPEAGVELSFAADERMFTLTSLGELLRRSGLHSHAIFPTDPLTLEEATGTLAAATLAKFVVPKWRSGREDGRAWVCLSHAYPTVARAALIACRAAIIEHRADAALPERLQILIRRVAAIDPITGAVMHAAAELGLEATFVSHRTRIYQIGQGMSGRHHVELASERDSVTGVRLGINKLASVELLRRMGLPTTKAVSLDKGDVIAAAAEHVGFPCVVKPSDLGKGKGITTFIQDQRQLATAVQHALQYGRYPLLLENHIAGDDHRLTVVGKRLLWAYRLRPAQVVGDGAMTLEELIGQENRRRHGASPAHKVYLQPIAVDAELLRYVADRYSFGIQSIPARGQHVELCGQANLARGGTLEDVTDQIHPDNREIAEQVARLFRLDVAGIDFIAANIARSWKDSPSAIVEVNSTPGISGLGDASIVLRTAFAGPLSGRTPCFVISGSTAYRQAIEPKLLSVLQSRDQTVARANYPDDPVPSPSLQVSQSSYSRMVETALLDPSATAIVISCEDEAIERFGFPLRQCELLFRESAAVTEHFEHLAGEVIVGPLPEGQLARVVADALNAFNAGLALTWPTLELLGANGAPPHGSPLKLRCWRVAPRPRVEFWRFIPGRSGHSKQGMIGYDDLATAVVQFADAHLLEAGEAPSGITISFPAVDGAWQIPHVESDIALPQHRAEVLREALGYGVAAVNELLETCDKPHHTWMKSWRRSPRDRENKSD